MDLVHTVDRYPQPGEAYLEPTWFMDYESPRVAEFVARAVEGARSAKEMVVKLYYAVRDGIRYDPFRVSLNRELYRASNVLEEGRAYCIPKAVLFTAGARACGIPAAIGLSDVVNHLTSEKLERIMGGSRLFIDHGYALLHIEGRWVKAAPAFNIELCERFHVRPTEFDGTSHALFQEYDAKDRRHMEYVNDHGVWSDLPFERIVSDFTRSYPPSFYDPSGAEHQVRFEDERPLT
ncbi:MAG: transglutaminase family protein [Betaproteobacteria bacterium]|nr:transglutaminase family protein [Betaproteobacteria bacterium]